MVFQLADPNQLPRRLRNAGLICHQLGQALIHGNGGSGNMRADIGDACHLQQSLHGAVLAVLAVKHREHHVDALPHHAVALEAQKPLSPDGGNGRPAVFRTASPFTGDQLGIVFAAVEYPVPLLRDAHGEQIILAFVNVIQHRLRRAQRNLMLRAHPAEENTNTEFFHVIASFYLKIRCFFARKADAAAQCCYKYIFYNFHLEIRNFGAIIERI